MTYYINKEKLEKKIEWLDRLGGNEAANVLRILEECLESDNTVTIPANSTITNRPGAYGSIDPVFPKNPEEGD
jgi:hypothetical protein